MRNYQEKRTWRNIVESKPVLIILGIIILVFAWNVLLFWNKMRETTQNKSTAEAKVAELKKQKEKLSSDINSLQTDEGKEKVFRENFGLAKVGEDLIVVVDDENPPKQETENSTGFWSFLKNLFK